MEFRLPNLGEGIESATVTGVLVKPGEAVTAGQNLVAVETDKAAVEVPAEADGVVAEVLVKPGDKVPVGAVLLTFRSGPADEAAEETTEETASETVGAATGRATAAPIPPPASAEPPAATPSPAAATDPSGNEFRLPNLGEGIEAATVTSVYVKTGDAVRAGQNVLAVETDKAAVEVPAEADGVVEAVYVKPGDKVPVGGRVLLLRPAGSGPTRPPVAQSRPPATSSEPRVAPPPPPTTAPARVTPNGEGPIVGPKTVIPAGPATRRLARELGVGLSEITGSGRGGRITLDDVKAFVRAERQRARSDGGMAAAPAASPAGGIIVNAFTLPPLPDFSKFGPVEVREVSTTRQTIAKNLTVGWRTMPMVTQHELADITDLEAGRKRIVEGLPKGAPKITMTVLAIKACVAALKEFPQFNSSYDMNAGKLILKHYYGIGIAVDTERGLVVPVIRDADKKSIRDLAAEVATLAEKARANKLAIDEMRGGTFTITNLGGIGGTAFTPIVNYPEVAILGLSRSSLQPVVRDGHIVPRLMMPLSLTYDHRVIDGADGCRFIVRLAQLFSDPIRLLMET